MGLWLVDADVLARSRFAVSPLLETMAALGKLAAREVPAWERPWLLAHADRFQARVRRDPFSRALVEDVLVASWVPDFMGRPPRGTDDTFEDELARLRATPSEVARADLVVTVSRRPLPAAVEVADPAAAVADLLHWVWSETVQLDWPRRRQLLHADVVGRAAALSRHGLAAALDDLGPDVRWLGEGRLQINTQDRPPRDLAGAELVLVPTTGPRPRVAWDLPTSYAIVYPAAGLLAAPGGDQRSPAALDAVRRLLGPTRADLLALVGRPASTSQLVATTGLSLGTVGHHLRVLLDAGLVQRRRAGATVLYYRSDLGGALLAQAGRPGLVASEP